MSILQDTMSMRTKEKSSGLTDPPRSHYACCARGSQENLGEPLTVEVARVRHNDGASCLEFIERGGHWERGFVRCGG